ncbi:LLM class flavin-dependent oxidoreductase [Paenibacillus hunanensis]|uniref:Alkanesulfonate monooxygenase n=1 Tax=Paenibacillus hunanensis TaxID=539262 RepID=A0ABU1ISS4_9BACL|nr:LLM class flavin-dependent oxidoreductase [Paenibacillus hunanensis]MDR6242298.1 alkanesulfonate monooxygenase [Paenibacillus hunanensis]GGJ06792.1 alkanesulfonate monooxygenase [Paenibacillus hunanensis]
MSSDSIYRDQVEFGWFMPTMGDGTSLGRDSERKPTLEYLTHVAQTAEKSGFEFVLIPTGGACIDSWVVGSAIIGATTTLKPLVAVRPGLIAPVLTARMAAALDQLSGGRARINIVTGSSPDDLEELGDPLARAHDEKYARTREYLDIIKGVWAQASGLASTEFGAGVDASITDDKLHYKGEYYEINGGKSRPATVQEPGLPIYFGGSSPMAKSVGAEYSDVFLMWSEPLDMIKQQIEELKESQRQHAERTGTLRPLRVGMRAQVLVRDTEEEAWEAARNLIKDIDPATIERAKAAFSKTGATGQNRQNQIRDAAAANDFIVGPNLWAGLSNVRSGGALMFVGTPDQVSDRLLEYAEAGVTSFILSSYPHLEEAAIFGESTLPLFKEKWSRRAAQQEQAATAQS